MVENDSHRLFHLIGSGLLCAGRARPAACRRASGTSSALTCPRPPLRALADMFVMTGWAGYVGFDISGYKNIAAFIARCQALPFVAPAQAEMAAAK